MPPCPLVFGALLNKVVAIASVDGRGFTLELPLADAERALGQLAVAIIEARAARRDAEHLDRR